MITGETAPSSEKRKLARYSRAPRSPIDAERRYLATARLLAAVQPRDALLQGDLLYREVGHGQLAEDAPREVPHLRPRDVEGGRSALEAPEAPVGLERPARDALRQHEPHDLALG